MSRKKSLIIVTAAYISTFIFGAFLTIYLPEGNSLSKLFVIDIFLTLFIFMFSFRFGNASMYDPYWSVIPAFMIGYWWYNTMAIPNYLVWGVTTFLVFIWAIRLTHNWARGWQGMQHQDWRYINLQETTGKWYIMVNFLGIHLFPTLLVWVACIPLAYIFTSSETFTWQNWLGVLVSVLGLGIEFKSQYQLRAFKKAANAKSILTTGMWSQIRHPNYVGEILFWWGLYFMSVGLFTPWYIIAGALGVTLFFLFVLIPMKDKHLLQTIPAYAGYMLKVGGILPKFKK
jgi:steroid 5-alpha reductase family enzyme